jgi:hypothetical protein
VTSRSAGTLACAVALALLASTGRGSAQGPAPAAPTPTPTLAPVPASVIRVDRARAGIPLGTSMTINVSGPNGPLAVQVPFDGLDASYDPLTHRLLLTGRAAGSGTLTLTDRDGNTAAVAVLVAPPAGVIPADVGVELAGNVSAAFVTARIRDAIQRALVSQPGTGLDVHGLTIPPTLAPGDDLEGQAGVTLDGRGTFVDVTGRIGVHVHVDPEPPLEPGVLFYSDDPEYIGAQLTGVLIDGAIDARTPARLFVYHVADGAARRISLFLRSPVTAHVQLLGTIGGVSPAYTYIGQQSTARFLAAHASGQSAILTVAAGTPYEIPLGLQQPGDLLEAIEDLRVLDGGPVDLTVVTEPDGAPLPSLDGPELPGDTHGRRGEFALANIAPVDLSFAGDAPEPAPVAVGTLAPANRRADGRPLAGDYGVVRPLALHLANATAAPLPVYLYELTNDGSGATVTVWFTGDPAPTLVPCVADAGQPHLIKAFTLAAGEARMVTGTFMTDGASAYPIRFGLSATAPPPAPPNGCAPAPAATPAPSPQP